MEKKTRVCDECGEEIEREERSLYKCVVCGKEMCSQCMSSLLPSMNGDDHEGATLCPTHYKQVKECINIMKGEKKGCRLYKEVPSGYGDVPLVEWGASDKPLWVMVSGVKFVPEKPLYAGCYVRREPFLLEEHIVVETRWGDELFDEPVARAALISDALFAYMEKEREG